MRLPRRCYDADLMFGMGGTEILVILIVALLFLGPDKLPEAAKQISKGIRDLRKQTREFQETIENDEKIGGAIRDLKSALNGEEPRPRPRPPKALPTPDDAAVASVLAEANGAVDGTAEHAAASIEADPSSGSAETAAAPEGETTASVTLPATAGEGVAIAHAEDGAELATMIKPAEGVIAKGSANGHG
jgi:sec-independent protein translocase protein TatB